MRDSEASHGNQHRFPPPCLLPYLGRSIVAIHLGGTDVERHRVGAEFFRIA